MDARPDRAAALGVEEGAVALLRDGGLAMTDDHDRALSSPVHRYLTLLKMFVSTSLSAEMEYRANFTFSVLSSAMNLGASVFTVRLFFSHGASLGGWSWSAALVVLGA